MGLLRGYVACVHALPVIDDTANAEHLRAGYYSVKALNPRGIVAVGPDIGCQGRYQCQITTECRYCFSGTAIR